jgi:hypothetical protein
MDFSTYSAVSISLLQEPYTRSYCEDKAEEKSVTERHARRFISAYAIVYIEKQDDSSIAGTVCTDHLNA